MSETAHPDIEYEIVDGQQTAVEREEIESNRGIEGHEPLLEPWDPAKIRVDPKQYSLRQIVDMIEDGELDLEPDFQRRRVWKLTQKSRLIESVLLRIPLPAFYFSADVEGRMQVVDGLQRLSTIRDFVNGDFELKDLEYLRKELAGKRFSEIENTVWGRRLKGTQIYANVIDPQTPAKVKFDIFKRINTLGEPLTAQEIRHCMSQRTSREFLKALANSPVFLQATGSSFLDHKRMADREAVLRFCAFRMLGDIAEYSKQESMDAFLTEATEKIDHLSAGERMRLKTDFEKAMENAYGLFGDHAFRKWSLKQPQKYPINKPLLEAWSVVLVDYSWETLAPRKDRIVEATREAMTNSWDFLEAISTGTGDPRKVELRFSVVRRIVEDGTNIAAHLPAPVVPAPRPPAS